MAAPGAAAAPWADPSSKYRWLILLGLIACAIMEVLDTTIVNVSLPQMAGNLCGATAEEIAWVSTGYILSNVVVLPVTAWLASRFGRRRYLVTSILIFTGSSILCGLSTTLSALVFFRIIQGAGGAALLSTAQATIREIFPPEEQALTQAIYILGVITAPTVGPTLGGWITDNYSWGWCFFINLPIGMVSFFIVSSFLKDSRFKMETGSVDWLGLGLLTVGLGTLQYALEEGNSKLWLESGTIVACLLTSAILLPTFVWWELSPENTTPIVNIRVLKNGALSAGLILFLTLGFGLYGGVFIYPLFAQTIIHLTPTQTGLALFPGGLATAISAFTVGRVLGNRKLKIPPVRIVTVGFFLFMASMFMLSSLPPTSGIEDAEIALVIRGLGLGMLFIPINIAAFASLKGPEIAQGSAMLNLCRQLGGSFGIAILATYLTNQSALTRSAMSAYYVVGSNTELRHRMGLIQGYMQTRGYSPEIASKASTGFMVRALEYQSASVAFSHAFMLIAFAVIATAPALLLLRTKREPIQATPIESH